MATCFCFGVGGLLQAAVKGCGTAKPVLGIDDTSDVAIFLYLLQQELETLHVSVASSNV
jgi:hypothetical protein